jgi:protein-arginine kinase activator protein McsA
MENRIQGMDQMEWRLQRCLENEDYESAAFLRDLMQMNTVAKFDEIVERYPERLNRITFKSE